MKKKSALLLAVVTVISEIFQAAGLAMEAPEWSYKRRLGFATTHGQMFEVYYTALLFLRGLNSGLEFQLATNVDGIGSLDDIVFRFKEAAGEAWTTLFVQMKYKDGSWVNQQRLISKSNDFSLLKMFKAYRDLENVPNDKNILLKGGSIDDSLFFLITNARPDAKLTRKLSDISHTAAKFLSTNSGSVFSFEGNEVFLESFGEHGDKFLERFLLFSYQKTGVKLVDVIKRELSKLNPEILHGVDIGMLCDRYLANVQTWCEKKDTVCILHKDHDILSNAVDQVQLETSSQRTFEDYKLAIDFQEDTLSSLRSALDLKVAKPGSRVVCIEASESSCRLSFTKVFTSIRKPPLVLDSTGVMRNKSFLVSEWKKGLISCLVICANDWNLSIPNECLLVVKDLLAATRNEGRIFILTNSIACVIKALTDHLVTFEIHKDDFSLQQLNVKSRNEILSKEVNLQGKPVALNQLLVDDLSMSADRMLDALSVVEILKCEGSLTVGVDFGEGIDYFVDRQLEVTTVLKPSLLEEGALSESVTVVVSQSKESVCFERFLEIIINFLHEFLSNNFPIDQRNKFLTSLTRLSSVCQDPQTDINVSPSIFVGSFEFNTVSLRFGQQDTVTALRVCTSKRGSEEVFVLFVSNKTNAHDVRILSEFNESKHFLSLADGKLCWTHSNGDINTLRPHIDKEQIARYNVMDVEDRLVLVCAEPGMGKSTLMTWLARETKIKFPHFFVVLLSLNDHTELFFNSNHNDALTFLMKAIKNKSHVHKSLLTYALEVSGNIVVLFDGYDEVAPRYVAETCALLSSLLETKASKIWMTSRNSIKNDLESRVSKFSVNIGEFGEDDQRNFLIRFWKEKSILDEWHLHEFIGELIASTCGAVGSKANNLLGIPLQIKMLAELYEDYVTGTAEVTKLPENLDFLGLLEQVVDKKCQVFVQDRLKVPAHDANYNYFMSTQNFIESHYKAGLDLILGSNQPKILESDMVPLQKLYEENSGFIDGVVNGKPRFVHRVYAEYFVAKWLSEKFADNRVLIHSKLFSADFSVVRNIFDLILAKNCSLHTAVLKGDLEKVSSLLKCKDFDIEASDKGGRTALHLAAGLGASEKLEVTERRIKILDLLIGKTSSFGILDNVLGDPPLRYADITQWWAAIDKLLHYQVKTDQLVLTQSNVENDKMLDTIFELDLDYLLDFCLKTGLAVEHCSEGKKRLLIRACKKGSLKVANLLVKNNANINNISTLFGGDSFKEIEEDQDDGEDIHEVVYTTPLHWASAHGHIEIVKLLCQKYISTPQNDLPRTLSKGRAKTPKAALYINVKDKNGETAIHHAAKNDHPIIIDFLKRLGGNEQCCNVHGITPLHWAAWYRHPKAVMVLLDAPGGNDAVNACDYDGDSVLHYAAEGGCVLCIELLVKAGGMLSKKNDAGQTPLTPAVEAGSFITVKSLLKLFDEDTNDMRKSDFINARDNNGETVIHVASRNGHADLVRFLITQGGDMCVRDNNNCTPLHWAARYQHPDTVKVLLDRLPKDALTDFINSRDNDGDSVLACARLGQCLESVKLLQVAGGSAAC